MTTQTDKGGIYTVLFIIAGLLFWAVVKYIEFNL